MTIGDENRVAWVTGAGKGIGRALTKRLTEDGWTVAASARTREDLASLEAECPQGRVHGFVLDVTDVPSTQATVNAIEARLGAHHAARDRDIDTALQLRANLVVIPCQKPLRR